MGKWTELTEEPELDGEYLILFVYNNGNSYKIEYYNSNEDCYCEIENCDICESPDFCLKCKTGYYFDNTTAGDYEVTLYTVDSSKNKSNTVTMLVHVVQ